VYAFAWKMKIVQSNHYLYRVDYIFANVVVKTIVKVSYMFHTQLYMNLVNLHNQKSNVSETHD